MKTPVYLLLVASLGASGPASTPMVPDGPPPSAGHAMVFHDRLNAVLLVNAGLGGMMSPPASQKTRIWRWALTHWTVIDSSGPPVRNLGGVSYDRARDRLVLYGGSYSQDLVYEDTWEWSTGTGWIRRDVPGPGKRDHGLMAYDEARNVSVLFGGQVTVDSFPADLWTWNGTVWQRSSATGPVGRVHHALAYDRSNNHLIVFGGQSRQQSLGDTWSWNGSGWSTVSAPAQPRTHARMEQSAVGMVVVGGFGEVPVLRLDGAAWMPMSGSGPGPRYLTAMAYDHRRQVTVLFGGGDPATDRLLADTWEFSAARGWERKN